MNRGLDELLADVNGSVPADRGRRDVPPRWNGACWNGWAPELGGRLRARPVPQRPGRHRLQALSARSSTSSVLSPRSGRSDSSIRPSATPRTRLPASPTCNGRSRLLRPRTGETRPCALLRDVERGSGLGPPRRVPRWGAGRWPDRRWAWIRRPSRCGPGIRVGDDQFIDAVSVRTSWPSSCSPRPCSPCTSRGWARRSACGRRREIRLGHAGRPVRDRIEHHAAEEERCGRKLAARRVASSATSPGLLATSKGLPFRLQPRSAGGQRNPSSTPSTNYDWCCPR